jgi:tryptophan-rich sensory protein
MRIPVESSTSYRGRNSRPNLPVLALLVLLALAAGVLAFLFGPANSAAAAHWYAALAKPAWLLPQQWFAPVWTALYGLMAIAAWLIWRERYHRARTSGMMMYALQLLLNAAWAPVFFGLKSIGAALFVAVALWLAVAWTVREFARVSGFAAVLLLPYLAWVSVAVAMNLGVWQLNP